MATATGNGRATVTKTGRIVQVIGSTFDAEFEEGHLPEIYNALKVDAEYKDVRLRLTDAPPYTAGYMRVISAPRPLR